MPGRPSASGYASGSTPWPGGKTCTWNHTVVADEAIYAIVHTPSNATGLTPQPTMTCGGIAMNPWGRLVSASSAITSAWAFSIPANVVPPGVQPIFFDNTAWAVVTEYGGQSCNVANAPSDACCILMGIHHQDTWPGAQTFTRSAYGWDPLGLQIAAGFVWPLAANMTLSGGTTLGTSPTDGVAMQTFDCVDDLIPFTMTSTHVGSFVMQLVGWMIPPDETTQPRTGGGFYPWLTWRTPSPGGVGSFVDAPFPYGGAATPQRECNVMLIPSTAHTWALEANQPPGSGNTVVAEIYRAGGNDAFVEMIPTGITLTLSGTGTPLASRSDLAALLSWARYERLSMRVTFTAGTSLPAGFELWAGLLIESGEDATQQYGGGFQTFNGAALNDLAYKAPLHPLEIPWSSTDSNKSVAGIIGTQAEMLVTYQTPTALADDHEFYMAKFLRADPLTEILQDGSPGTVDTSVFYPADTLGAAIARKRFSLPFAVGDLLAVAGVKRNAASGGFRHAATIKVVAQTRGEFMLSGHTAQTVNSVDYSLVPNASGGANALANEAAMVLTTPPMGPSGDDLHLRGHLAYVEPTGPDLGTLTFQNRKNLASTSMPDNVLTGSPADPLYSDVSGDVPYTDFDKISLLMLTDAAPVMARQFWSYVGFIEPPPLGGEIVVEKITLTGDPATIFDFNAVGLSPSTFQLADGQSQSFPGLTPGSGYGISETPPPGWNDPVYAVSNGSPIDNILVEEGLTTTVIVTNSLCPGEATGQRTDGVSYSPVVVAPCGGTGTRSGSRTGS